MKPKGRTISARAGLTIGADASVTELRKERRSASFEVGKDAVRMSGTAWSYYKSQPRRQQMLVLDREEGERMRINGSVELIVLGIESDQIRLAIMSSRENFESPVVDTA